MKSSDGANRLRAFKATSEKVATNISRGEKNMAKIFFRKSRQEKRELEDFNRNFYNAEAVLRRYAKHLIDF